ncbi:hypothetical protein [Archaeoglobus sp.]
MSSLSSKLLVLVAIAAVILSGCSGNQKTTTETPAKTPKQSTGSSEVPIYSGSKLYTAPTFYYTIFGIPNEGVSIKIYYVKNAKVEDVLNWYKKKLSDYEIVDDISIATVSTPQGNAEWGSVVFKKGNEAIGIWAISGMGVENGEGTVYYIVKGPVDKLTEESSAGYEAKQLPSSDQVSGEEPVARYPGSVMLSYYRDNLNTKISINIVYGTKDDASKVAKWYRDEFNSWKLKSDSSDSSGYYMTFSKGNEMLHVEIIKPTETVKYTEIRVEYTREVLPSHDVVQGKEPMERYPGSVMLEYSKFEGGYDITYGTYDEPKKVFDWYSDKLRKDGWKNVNVVAKATNNEEYTISADKENSFIQVEITKQHAYTEIHLIIFGK